MHFNRQFGSGVTIFNPGDPLYRKVLERYVQMATEGGVVQAPERVAFGAEILQPQGRGAGVGSTKRAAPHGCPRRPLESGQIVVSKAVT